MPAPDRQFPRGPLARIIYGALLAWFWLSGWRAEGAFPDQRKFVIIGASHTSNFDFIVFLGTVHALGRRIRFIGKHSLFRGPMGGFMRALGGVPVDRSARQDMVSQIVDQFALQDDFALIVAAEGTRAATTKWRTGFYQIALKAGVPIVCAGPDYSTKR
ncbi:MAG: 1-acyl-sn-glycerol-3-phosphate acyltransferase, partial [Sphingomonas bacterium]|nr:1-acyl-sn-glycerol-3-phosphate acyltransferase [Sphingomonas bacterium]